MINKLSPSDWDVIAIQEPPIARNKNPISITHMWEVVLPTDHLKDNQNRSRSMLLVSKKISTNCWKRVEIASPDITIIEFKTQIGNVQIINLYNDCDHDDSLLTLDAHFQDTPGNTSIILLGDFNRHHPLWDDPKNEHLLTDRYILAAEPLIRLVEDCHLRMALPKIIPTHRHLVSKKLSWLDNVFVSELLLDHINECNAHQDRKPISTDHFPIVTKLDLSFERAGEVIKRAFGKTDWEEFEGKLRNVLEGLPTSLIESTDEFDERLEALTVAITETIKAVVPTARITAYCKRWWTKELSELRARRFNLGYCASRKEDYPEDPIHQEHAIATSLYKTALEDAKDKCWYEFIDMAVAADKTLWNAHKWLKNQDENTGNARVPTLRSTSLGGMDMLHSTNEEKSSALYQTFFPTPPPINIPDHVYPNEIESFRPITEDEIYKVIGNLKPDKAPGPDGIPNCVYTRNATLLVPHLLPLYQATFRLEYYPDAWKKSTTVVLWKPGRPDYTATKAYRPIALLNVMSKILSSCIANRLNTIVETNNLLPAHHFGGRAGHTTSDSMHLLHKFVKDAWRKKKVIAGLFLDVMGAFPNASPNMLIHNMKKLGIPTAIVNWMARKLEGRETVLKFDDFTSDPFEIRHGIDQGCPLSCIFYLIYNSNLIRVAQNDKGELAVGYIDDVAFLAEGVDFIQANKKLKRMMERRGGALEWARTHTSEFALEKTALVQFNRYLQIKLRPVVIGGVSIKPKPSQKFLGVIFDAKLTWAEQRSAVLRKATKWAQLVKRVCRIRHGFRPASARKLHDSVFISRVTYAADVWWEPTGKREENKRRSGAVGFTKHLQSAQRTVALAITGTLRTSPTDTLLAHAGIFPIELELRRASHRSAVRLAGIPSDHPLRSKVNSETKLLKKHRTHQSTIRKLLLSTGVDPARYAVNPRFNTLPPALRLLKPYIAPGGKDQAIADEMMIKPMVKIFSDGSMVGGGVGAVAVLLCEGKEAVVARKYVGIDKEHEVYEAEVVGLILGLELLAREREVKEAVFFIDNQAVLLTLTAGHTEKLGYLYALLDEGIRAAREANPGIKLETRWIPGHKGVFGNERADEAAKLAATPGNDTHLFFSGPMRKEIPINPTAAKRMRKSEMEEDWKEWTKEEGNADRTARMWRIDDTYPSMQFRKAANTLSRYEYAILTQLRTGHYPTATYLFRSTLADSPRCPYCETRDETVLHLLMGCEALEGYRRDRDQAMGTASRSVEYLLKPGEHTKHLIEYIRRARGLAGGQASQRAERGEGE